MTLIGVIMKYYPTPYRPFPALLSGKTGVIPLSFILSFTHRLSRRRLEDNVNKRSSSKKYELRMDKKKKKIFMHLVWLPSTTRIKLLNYALGP